LLLALGAPALPGCIDISIPVAPTLFPTGTSFVLTGTSFVLTGTATIIDNEGPCLVWEGENGVIYDLFQDGRVANEDFDLVTTPGVTSRLLSPAAVRPPACWTLRVAHPIRRKESRGFCWAILRASSPLGQKRVC
jgi:hypothetical protein